MNVIAILMVCVLVSAPVYAKKPSAALQVELQAAMLAHNDSILVEGAYSYLDTKTDELNTVYPANAHPFVVTLGEDYFVCSEFVTDDGDSVTADYLVRQIEGQFKVVQIIMNDRESLKNAMKKVK